MELKDRMGALLRSLPPAQRVGIGVAIAVLIMAAVPFAQWILTPSYAMLYSGMSDTELAQATTELDNLGVPYQLEGNRVMVPQDQLHLVRAQMAEAGVSGSPVVPGYELLDEQALGVSDFRQRVDLQRAVEGELARTLGAMDAIDSATVRLVIPEDSLFTDRREPASASVLLRANRTMDVGQVEAVTLVVASAVEGLEPDQITVADTTGEVLHAPGDGSTGGVTDRQQRRTRDFENALASDLTQLLQRATDAPASVVVRATLDFDERSTETEVFDEGGIPLREQTSDENFEGVAPAPGGIVGVDGGPLPQADGAENTYERAEATREFGVDRTITRIVQAPGTVQRLSVAAVVDEGAMMGDAELAQLIAAAAGVVDERGDQVAITRVVTPPPAELPAVDEAEGLLELIQQIAAVVVLLVIAVALFLMSRRRSGEAAPAAAGTKVVPATVRPAALAQSDDAEQSEPKAGVRHEVAELVERQPEEIAALLRGWLADRRAS